MLSYRLVQKTKVLAGSGVIRQLPQLLEETGFCKPFLVFDQGLSETTIITCITDLLNKNNYPYAIYDRITPDPAANLVDGIVHIGHCIAHEIGAAFHIPHGAACSYAFPAMVKHIAYADPDKIKYAGKFLGASFDGSETPDVIAQKTCDAYIHFRDNVVSLTPLSHYEPDLSKVNLSMAKTIAKDPLTSMTPVPVTLEDVMYMLYTIFV